MLRTVARSARTTASPELRSAVVFVIRGARSAAARETTGGPAPISRCPGFSAMPPSSAACERKTTIRSPGAEARSTRWSEPNGACREPLPPSASALTNHVRAAAAGSAAPATASVASRQARTRRKAVNAAARTASPGRRARSCTGSSNVRSRTAISYSPAGSCM